MLNTAYFSYYFMLYYTDPRNVNLFMRVLLITLIIFSALPVFSQEEEGVSDNTEIQKMTRSFIYTKGNSKTPVLVKEETEKVYTCTQFRTQVHVAESYSDMETIDDVKIRVDGSKKHGIIPKYEYYSVDGIFYSDARICYFDLPLVKKGSISEVVFEKTILDPRYFTLVYFMEDQAVREQTLTVTVPEWMKAEIREYNLEKYQVQKNVSTSKNGDKVYEYKLSNVPAFANERWSPGPTHYAPHLLILNQSATPDGNTYTYFRTLQDQYAWYRSLIIQNGTAEASVKEKAMEITGGLTGDEQKVKAIFQWVQDNVRYIAFENGIAGFKPARAQDVLRKKYGDCKGMANLVTEMLRGIGLDARNCWLGTNHIAHDYSTPSLCVDNHMISAWMRNGKPVFLDATEKFTGMGEVAERIQGRQVLIENGDSYLLEKIESPSFRQNTAYESRKFTIEGNNLAGHITHTWKGASKQRLLSGFHESKKDKQEAELIEYLSEGKPNFAISNLKIRNISNYQNDLELEYDVNWKNVLTVFGEEAYLELDNRRLFDNFSINKDKRKLPYCFNSKEHWVFETILSLPSKFSVQTLPEKLMIRQPGYDMTASYTQSAGTLTYTCEISLKECELKPSDFGQWNQDIERLTSFYNQQIVLQQKK